MKARRAHPLLSEPAAALVAARFRALADASRIRLLNRLMRGERAVQELVGDTGLSQPNVSRHLGKLRDEGIVERRTEGARVLYRIADPTVIALCEIVCGGLTERAARTLRALPARSR